MAVPIVLARKYYQKLGIPDDSYIAIDDFENLEDFVAEVNKVANDKQLYLKYHKWRETYRQSNFQLYFSAFMVICNEIEITLNDIDAKNIQ